MHGEPVEALRSNVGATVLVSVLSLLGPWLFVSAIFGRWFFKKPDERWILWIVLVVVMIMVVDWAFRLMADWGG